MIVGYDQADVVVDIHCRIEDGDGDAGADDAFDRIDEGAIVSGGYGESIDAPGNHGVHDFDLAAVVGLDVRTAPVERDMEIPGGAFGSGSDGNKEEIRIGLGDDRDGLSIAAAAS